MSRLNPLTWTRETRLLVTTVLLSVSVLLALSRLRFPEQPRLELPAQPLQRLADRAAFDDLTAAVTRVLQRIQPSLVRVAIAERGEAPRSYSLEDILREPEYDDPPPLVLGYRVSPERALVVSPGRPVVDMRRVTSVVAQDELHGVSLVAVERGQDLEPLPTTAPAPLRYVLVAQATRSGISLRPLFGGSTGRTVHSQWGYPVVALGARSTAAPGALVFSIDAAFVGAIELDAGAEVIVAGSTLLRLAETLASQPPRGPSTIGIHVQALNAAASAATGASAGVLVSGVDAGAPAASAIVGGDVLVSVAGRFVSSPAQALVNIASLPADHAATLTVWRGGRQVDVSVVPRSAGPRGDPANTKDAPGIRTAGAAGGVVVTQVTSGGSAERAGLDAGDLITTVAGRAVTRPSQVTAAYDALAPGGSLLVGIERRGEPILLVLARPDYEKPRPEIR